MEPLDPVAFTRKTVVIEGDRNLYVYEFAPEAPNEREPEAEGTGERDEPPSSR
ncbi:MAG: hypothetical protein KIS66_14345 [Fimbriimonadaceae bacterium]|nr:hypothetical protein [Fimbriimonadaceae bacterium]